MKMKNRLKELGIFLEDLTYNASYTFLEEGKDDNELKEVAQKSGLSLPSKDLSIFKCIYAFVDMENKNGCTLPKEEVSERLHTLVGKAIDLDHFRKRTVGYWIHAELSGDKIMAYGAFWKNNFSEEFDEIKRMLSEGALKISFEAWGDRVYKGGRSYDLTNIEFAGGALLITTQPAFAGAKVLEMAKTMEAPKDFLYERGKIEDEFDLEESQFHFHEYEIIARLLNESTCPSCKSKGTYIVDSIDFPNSFSKVSCGKCGAKYHVNFEPETDLKKKGKKVKDFLAVVETKGSVDIEKLDEFSGSEEDLEMMLAEDLEEAKKGVCKNCGEPCPEDKPLCDECQKDEDEKEDKEEAKKLTYKERKGIDDDMFAVVKTVKNKVTGEPRKIRMFPIHDPAHVRNALARLPQATETLRKLGISPETVKQKILRRARALNMKDLLARHKEESMADEKVVEKSNDPKSICKICKVVEVADGEDFCPTCKTGTNSIPNKAEDEAKKDETKEEAKQDAQKTEEKVDEVATLKTQIETLTKSLEDSKKALEESTAKLESLTKEFEAAKTELAKANESLKAKEDAEKAEKVKTRRDALGEFAKDVSDEDILDDLKYENATLKKALSEKNPEVAKKLEIASKDKSADTGKTVWDTQKKVQEKFRKSSKG